MYKYENIIIPHISGDYKISTKGELMCRCPFHNDHAPSFNINLQSRFL